MLITKTPKFKRMMKLFNDTEKIGYKHTYTFEATKGRSESTKDLTEEEVDEIIGKLEPLLPKKISVNEAYPERKAMRGKIIHFLCLLGYVTKSDKPDFDRIDRFIVNIGNRNPRKVILNYLYPKELKEVLTQVEAMYKKELTR
jgi:hypothetical protein